MKSIDSGISLEGIEVPEEKSYFFEGTEKLLEIHFSSTNPYGHPISHIEPDLRNIERSSWDKLLEHAKCEILSQTNNSSIYSFVLSESSMFITKDRFILKTCGKTALLGVIKPLLRLVHDKCGYDSIVDMFYSHKNYMRPDLQPSSHRKFDDEVDLLNEIFEDGAAYAFGRINRDCWYLYTLDLIGVVKPDQTLEVIMTKVDRDVMSMFYQSYGLSADQLTKKTGIADLLPGAILDAFLFDPCGYSINGILPDGCYFTIHITPEDEFSYVSFETNVPQESYKDLVNNLLDIFKPGKAMVTLLANEDSITCDKELSGRTEYQDYKRVDHQLCCMKNYYLTYTQYMRTHLHGLPPPQ